MVRTIVNITGDTDIAIKMYASEQEKTKEDTVTAILDDWASKRKKSR